MSSYSSAPLLVHFTGGEAGAWRVASMTALAGAGLAPAPRLDVREGAASPDKGAWTLRGVAGHVRYTTRDEFTRLSAKSAGLSRPEADRAALIPIRKNPGWWALTQDERREIYEERSRHTTIGLDYLPEIARRLHHSRDLGEAFDFLTWFEFSSAHEARFDELLDRLRGTEEWNYVDREVDIRLHRAP